MFLTFCVEITTAMEYFMAGSSAAISLFCGVKLPKKRGRPNGKNTRPQ